MLARLTRRFRLKSAIGLAALYVVCILGPHVALALGSASAAHCLTDSSATAHVHKTGTPSRQAHTHGDTHHHDDGATHRHADEGPTSRDQGGDDKNHSGTCCGLFCVSAMTADCVDILAPASSVSTKLAGFSPSLAGRGPGRINRPPIG
jgi:hypothetical protein